MLERIKKVVKESGLSNGDFARRLGVKPSSISHILSGRNKPSLDFVTKLLRAFPSVDAYWLLFGRDGGAGDNASSNLVSSVERESGDISSSGGSAFLVGDEDAPSYGTETKTPGKTTGVASAERIVVFYADGTFKSYRPR